MLANKKLKRERISDFSEFRPKNFDRLFSFH